MRRIAVFIMILSLLVLPVQGAPRGKLVALTFDDGPSGRFTKALLDGLEARDAKATFFLCGYRIAQYPELTQRIFRSLYAGKLSQNLYRLYEYRSDKL